MTQLHTTIEIDSPAAVVFDYIADMSNNPQWQNGMERCEWTSEPPLRIGSTYDQTARFLGKSIVSSFAVTELEPGERIRIVSTSGTMPIDVTRAVRPLGEQRCEVVATVVGDPPRLMKLLGPLLDRFVARSVRRDYEKLKELIEASSE